MERKQCSTCKKTLPATNKYFYSNPSHRGGLHNICITCSREYQRKYREQAKLERKLNKTYNDEEKRKNKLRRKSKKDYRLGKEYKLKIDLGRNRKKLFQGRLIQETYDFITLKSKEYTESFLKVDIGNHIKLISEV